MIGRHGDRCLIGAVTTTTGLATGMIWSWLLSDTTSQSSAVGQPELFQRKHPLAECERCPLNKGSVYVPLSGPGSADLAFVGEAPGLNEARTGVPFTGPSGKLLN